MRTITRTAQVAFLARYQTEKTVLDIGAGNAPPYKHLFPNRLRVDVNPEKKPDIVADIADLPFERDSQDIILCLEVFEHLPNPQKAADELYRVLKKDGILILTTRSLFPLHGVPHDYWRYTPYSIQKLFKEWKIEIIEFETEAFSSIGVILQRICLQTELRGGKVVKAILYALAFLISKLDFLVKNQYGEIERKNKTKGVFSTGLYMVAKKK